MLSTHSKVNMYSDLHTRLNEGSSGFVSPYSLSITPCITIPPSQTISVTWRTKDAEGERCTCDGWMLVFTSVRRDFILFNMSVVNNEKEGLEIRYILNLIEEPTNIIVTSCNPCATPTPNFCTKFKHRYMTYCPGCGPNPNQSVRWSI